MAVTGFCNVYCMEAQLHHVYLACELRNLDLHALLHVPDGKMAVQFGANFKLRPKWPSSRDGAGNRHVGTLSLNMQTIPRLDLSNAMKI